MATQYQPNRRHLLTSVAATGIAASLPSPVRAFGRTALGSREIMVLSDGNLALPVSFAFPDVPQDELGSLLDSSGQNTGMLTPDCNIALMRDGDRLVMFDVGAGSNFMPTAGMLADSLEQAGIDAGEVTDVVFTHAHPDHIWGLLDDFDELVFAEANYHINRIEWDYWRKENTLTETPEARKSFVIGARNRFEYLKDRINLFGYGDEVLPGVEAVDTSGHTPGHTSFALHDGNESIVIAGDAVTNVAISFAKPDWPSGSDQDTGKGIETRVKLLDRLATEKLGMVGFHMPHPGIGRIESAGTGYRFVT